MARPRLVFIDDDPQELVDLGSIVGDDYDYTPVKWPVVGPIERSIGAAPAIFLLDLYFPRSTGVVSDAISEAAKAQQSASAKKLSQQLLQLYEDVSDGKRLLRETFACVQGAYELLWAQCQELGQSAENGRALLARLKAHAEYRKVPAVFYSRKVTVQEAVRALQAGAVSVIPKVSSPPRLGEKELVLNQIKYAQSLSHGGWKVRAASLLGINVNVTLFQQDFTQQKAEMVVFKAGG